MTVRPLSALVVATGDGTPMRSARPKPIHLLCGRAMASYVLRALGAAGVDQAVVVTGPDGGRVSKRLLEDAPAFPLRFVEHPIGQGTAEAALAGLSALDLFEDDADLLVLPADLPLLRAATVTQLVERHRSTGAACTVLTAISEIVDPVLRRRQVTSGVGDVGPGPDQASVVSRDRRGRVAGVVSRHQAEIEGTERADELSGAEADGWERGMPTVSAEPDTIRLSRRNRDAARRALTSEPEPQPAVASFEMSLGVFCVRSGLLAPALRRLNPSRFAVGRRHSEPVLQNSMRFDRLANGGVAFEEVIAVLAASGHTCETARVEDVGDLIAVDSRVEMADAEAELRRRTNRHWLQRGVSMVDPARTYLDATVELGIDVTLFPGTILQGNTVIGDGCEIGPDVHMDGSRVGEGSTVAKTTAVRSSIGRDCVVGPFAALGPGSEVRDGTVTGPFYAGDTTE